MLGRKRSAFNATRLNSSTFLIKEFDDIYSEHPLIYAKLIPDLLCRGSGTILLIDTGCGGASNDPDVHITSLREFIETVDVQDNEDRPLNPVNGKGERMSYIVTTTHCHYDHILGVEHFSDSPIFASSHSPEFLLKTNIPENSLCNFLHIRTPVYELKQIPHGHIICGVTVLHTPGHTPDSLVLYDPTCDPQMLYVGDTLYEHEHIIFPNEGSIVDWFSSVEMLIEFVKTREESEHNKILLNAGHVTFLQPALLTLLAVKSFMRDVVEGREGVRKRWIKRGKETVEYRQENGVFSLICPEILILDARRRLDI